jgi:photosystem II stability/assembly factor-like uncharacterized protein
MNTWVSAGVYLGAAHVFLSESGDGVLVLRLNVAEGSIDLFTSVDRGETFAQTTITGLTLQETVPFADWHIFVDSTLTLILIPNGENCLLSNDGGVSFSEVLLDIEPELPPWKTYATGSSDGVNLAVIGISPEGGGTYGLFLSTDSGASWAPILSDDIGIDIPQSVAISDDGLTVLVVGTDALAVIYCAASEDGGVTWGAAVTLDEGFPLARLEMARNGSVAWASQSGYVLLKTSDLGATWSSDAVGFPRGSTAISADAGVLTAFGVAD